MTDIKKNKTEFDSTNLILFLWKRRVILIIVTLVAAIASAIFSSPFFITPKFKSTVVMFPTSSNAISKALLSDRFGGKQDILEFGEEEQAEQMLQILNSSQIRNNIIEKYNLMEHYDIDSTSKYKKTNLTREYNDNITFKRTEFMAVEVKVMDKDPVIAANIANDIADLLDSTKNKMQKERAIPGFKITEKAYFDLKNDIKKMEDSLIVLRELGVFDFESQSEMIYRQLAIEIPKGSTRRIQPLRDELKILKKYGVQFVSIRDQLEYEKKQLSIIKSKYEEAKVDATQFLPHRFVVDRAFPAEKKSYPVRWLIVVVATLAAFVLAVLLIIFMENINKARKESKAKQ
jgi:uncharacterized protein involved in exopolysaccharide biosynthesis